MKILDNIAPAAEPVTLAQARTHLKLDVVDGEHPDDALVTDLITAAREHVENATQLVVAARAVTVVLDQFPAGAINLGVWPVSSVVSVMYERTPSSWAPVLSDAYRLDAISKPAEMHPKTAWPLSTGTVNNITIGLQAGWAPNEMPKAIKQAMLLLIGHWYENREAVSIGNSSSELPKSVDSLLDPHRIRQGV